MADGSQFTVGVAWHTFRRVQDRALLQRIIDRLVKAMQCVPRNPATGLVHIRPGGYDRCPYGFTDTVREQGDVLFCSLLQVEASRRLADLLAAVGRPADAEATAPRGGPSGGEHSRRVLGQIVRSVPRRDGAVQRARYLGIGLCRLSGRSVGRTVAGRGTYFQRHYDQLVQCGQIRHLPGGMYWQAAGPKDEYQNGGFWPRRPAGSSIRWTWPIRPWPTGRCWRWSAISAAGESWSGFWERKRSARLRGRGLPITGIEKMLERRKAARAAGR